MKKNILRGLFLALSAAASSNITLAVLPEDITESLKTALNGAPCIDFILGSMSQIYDAEVHPKKKRVVERFVRNILDGQENVIREIEAHYERLHYIRTGSSDGVDQDEWNTVLREALEQYKAAPRANPLYHFNVLSFVV